MATMLSSAFARAPQQVELEDPLTYLPRSTVVEYKRKEVIYSPNQPSKGLYVVIDGGVKVCRLADDGQEAVVDIYRVDDVFGESGLLDTPHPPEQATALEDTRLMTWTSAEIEAIITKRPLLAVALLQILVQRTIDFGRRIASFSRDQAGNRLARSLVRLSERLGEPQADGSVQMAALTHQILSQYVGTSREIISYHMNQFRRQGYVRYSRKGITVYSDAFKESLRHSASLPAARS